MNNRSQIDIKEDLFYSMKCSLCLSATFAVVLQQSEERSEVKGAASKVEQDQEGRQPATTSL